MLVSIALISQPAPATVAALAVVALLLALWIDRRFGEPPTNLHPVVWMGRFLQRCGAVTTRQGPLLAFVLGAVAWCVGACLTGAVAWAAQTLLLWQVSQLATAWSGSAWLGAVVVMVGFAWLLKTMLALRMLRSEVLAVEAALAESLGAGRERLSWLVSRDTAELSAGEVRESAIESLAENLHDSVVAPIFWFVLLGLPGAAVYRFANTADAMWGYRGTRHGQMWEWAGKWAAWADDMLSWVPARLTALLIVLVSPGIAFKTLRAEARRTPSPNSGWPMAAMAIALGIRLGKPGVYTLNCTGLLPEAADTTQTIQKASHVVLALVLIACSAMVLVAMKGAVR